MTTRHWSLVTVTLPAAVLAAVWGGSLVMAARGPHPMWRVEPITLAEAAALRDGGEVARLVVHGGNPRLAYDVRPGFLFRRAARVTPMDAAIAASRPEIVQLLLELGVSLDPLAWPRARCQASDRDVRAVLDAVRPEDPDLDDPRASECRHAPCAASPGLVACPDH